MEKKILFLSTPLSYQLVHSNLHNTSQIHKVYNVIRASQKDLKPLKLEFADSLKIKYLRHFSFPEKVEN